MVADSRSLRSAPTAWVRGIDGGKLVKGVKLFAVCDKHGSLLDLELRPANTDDRAGVLPMLPRLAALGFEGDLLGDSGFKGAPFAAAALEHDIHVSISPGGTRDGRFLPNDLVTVTFGGNDISVPGVPPTTSGMSTDQSTPVTITWLRAAAVTRGTACTRSVPTSRTPASAGYSTSRTTMITLPDPTDVMPTRSPPKAPTRSVGSGRTDGSTLLTT